MRMERPRHNAAWDYQPQSSVASQPEKKPARARRMLGAFMQGGAEAVKNQPQETVCTSSSDPFGNVTTTCHRPGQKDLVCQSHSDSFGHTTTTCR
ncbi:MAG TPA: hypothetical protein VGF08_08240 [Terriglobales bacterium]